VSENAKTECCAYEGNHDDWPVKWNEWNRVVQCHICGKFYEPIHAAIKAAQQPAGYDTLSDSKFDAKFKHVGVSPQAQPDGWVSEWQPIETAPKEPK
jgi:hypothetical protein